MSRPNSKKMLYRHATPCMGNGAIVQLVFPMS